MFPVYYHFALMFLLILYCYLHNIRIYVLGREEKNIDWC